MDHRLDRITVGAAQNSVEEHCTGATRVVRVLSCPVSTKESINKIVAVFASNWPQGLGVCLERSGHSACTACPSRRFLSRSAAFQGGAPFRAQLRYRYPSSAPYRLPAQPLQTTSWTVLARLKTLVLYRMCISDCRIGGMKTSCVRTRRLDASSKGVASLPFTSPNSRPTDQEFG